MIRPPTKRNGTTDTIRSASNPVNCCIMAFTFAKTLQILMMMKFGAEGVHSKEHFDARLKQFFLDQTMSDTNAVAQLAMHPAGNVSMQEIFNHAKGSTDFSRLVAQALSD